MLFVISFFCIILFPIGLEPQFGRLSRSNFDDLGVRYDTGMNSFL